MKSSYYVEFRRISIQSEFHVFRGTKSGDGHLAHFEWLKMRHVSSGELVKQCVQVWVHRRQMAPCEWMEIHGRWIRE